MQGYGNHGTYFKFEGAQNSVRFGPTAGMVSSDNDQACASQVTFSGHGLSAKVGAAMSCPLLIHHCSICISCLPILLCMHEMYATATCL